MTQSCFCAFMVLISLHALSLFTMFLLLFLNSQLLCATVTYLLYFMHVHGRRLFYTSVQFLKPHVYGTRLDKFTKKWKPIPQCITYAYYYVNKGCVYLQSGIHSSSIVVKWLNYSLTCKQYDNTTSVENKYIFMLKLLWKLHKDFLSYGKEYYMKQSSCFALTGFPL